MNEVENMPVHTSYIVLFFKNLPYLLTLAFGWVMNKLMIVFPDWKDLLENIKQIGGTLVILLVIVKLLFEIRKLKRDK